MLDISDNFITVKIPLVAQNAPVNAPVNENATVNAPENATVNENATENAPENATVNENATENAPENATVNENATENAPENATVKPNTLQEQIIALIADKPDITYSEIVSILGKDRRTVSRNIKKLKELGIVERIGTDKKGYWKVKR